MSAYDKILENTVDKPPMPSREWMGKPFKIGDTAYSTDGYMMTMVPADKTEHVEELEGYRPDKVINAIPKERDRNVVITMSHIDGVLSKIPRVPEQLFEDCPACDGTAVVEWDFTHSGRSYSIDHECPVCNGEGEFHTGNTGRLIVDGDYRFDVLDCRYAAHLFDRVVWAAKTLGSTEIVVRRQVKNKATIFAFLDVEILLMPTLIGDNDKDNFKIVRIF